MSAAETSWVLQSLLATLQGDPSVGKLSVRATGGTVFVPRFSIAIPVLQGGLAYDCALEVQPNDAREDKAWEVTTAGLELDVMSIQSGARVNLPAGTLCRFLPEIGGLDLETIEVAAPGLNGGSELDGFGALKQIRRYKDLGTRPQAQDFFKAQVNQYPAAVLSWLSCVPADGSSTPALGPTAARLGSGVRLYKQSWILHLVTSRLDATDLRTEEGDRLRDDVLELLNDRHAFRGRSLSSPMGIELLSADLEVVTPTSYVDAVRFTTTEAIVRRKLPSDQTWSDWKKTRVVREVPAVIPPAAPGEPALEFPDVTDPMPPNP